MLKNGSISDDYTSLKIDKRIKIAYAEPQILIRKGICGLINTFIDCQVILEANKWEDLINGIRDLSESPSLCILNTLMLGMNIKDAILFIRNEWPKIKILILADDESIFLRRLVLNAGAAGYLQKNCSVNDLYSGIQSIYATGSLRFLEMKNQNYTFINQYQKTIPELTSNEIDLLRYACSDLSYTQIADMMGTTMHSVDWYRNSLFKKLNVKSRSSLVMFAIQMGLATPNIVNITSS